MSADLHRLSFRHVDDVASRGGPDIAVRDNGELAVQNDHHVVYGHSFVQTLA